MAPRYGEAVSLASGVRAVLAPNPSPMTAEGTVSYVLEDSGEAVVIDPGPEDGGHLAALRSALAGLRLRAVVVTHPHLDHSPLARTLGDAEGAEVVAFGRHDEGRAGSAPDVGGGEGVDRRFAPDRRLGDGSALPFGGATLRMTWTPGHMAPHLTPVWAGVGAFTGDVVMGWASTMISPPDGHLGQFLGTLDRLEALGPVRAFPGHGAPVEHLAARCRELRAHRMERERQVLGVLVRPTRIAEVVAALYADVPATLHPAAGRNVLAHLLHLRDAGRVKADPAPGVEAVWRRLD